VTATDPLNEYDSESLQVVVGNRPPTVTITSPVSGTVYNDDETVVFAGTGDDPEDGQLTGQNLLWQVTAHNDQHILTWYHTNGNGGNFPYPRSGGEEVYRVRLCLTGEDGGIPSTGGLGKLQTETCIWLYPSTLRHSVRLPIIMR
jgi:hypothetical protein